MKIAIVGSRDWNDENKIAEYIHDLPSETVIVSGGARGVDSMAAKWAKFFCMTVEIYTANWGKYGKSAGMIRNSEIVEACDRVVAFWDGKSKGTLDTINKAKKAGKVVEVITP